MFEPYYNQKWKQKQQRKAVNSNVSLHKNNDSVIIAEYEDGRKKYRAKLRIIENEINKSREQKAVEGSL